MKIPIRAAQNRQRGHMRPAGRQFDMADLNKQIRSVRSSQPHLTLQQGRFYIII